MLQHKVLCYYYSKPISLNKQNHSNIIVLRILAPNLNFVQRVCVEAKTSMQN